jgi:hypothetical protein
VQAGVDKKMALEQARRVQRVASRTFYQNGTRWEDATFDAKKQKEIVKIKAFSPAYFALMKRNSSFAKWAALGEDVLITANATQAIQFGKDGKEELTQKELDDLTR